MFVVGLTGVVGGKGGLAQACAGTGSCTVSNSLIHLLMSIQPASVTRNFESGKALEILDRQSELLVGLTAQCLHTRISVGLAEITKLS